MTVFKKIITQNQFKGWTFVKENKNGFVIFN